MPAIHQLRATAATLLVVAAGCGPPSVDAPSYSAGSAATAAMSKYDADKNGSLNAAEIAASPAIKSAVKSIDADGDGSITAEELQQRIASYQSSGIALMPFRCRIMLDKTPLAGAAVKFVPEEGLSDAIKPAVGKTTKDGWATMVTEGAEAPAVHCGLYRIQVTTGDGAAVPERYAAGNDLGQEVSGDTPGIERGVTYTLTKSAGSKTK